eukprot:TRINITY_DN2079_c0_g1_i2.p1 TRINITY_DN2079_c0_g1~~TRINITY_DN2079_c0_g1_i2.p1  ORF type:complete len:318 (+),score=48.98 TRINITY_DN2079_c0_g1_i2:286-1239(+)
MWGSNQHQQLGLDTKEVIVTTPHRVEALAHVKMKRVSCGGTFTVALSWDGDLYVWGGTEFPRKYKHNGVPEKVMLDLPVVKFACGNFHILFLTCDGTLFGLGKDDEGQLGQGHLKGTLSEVPVKIPLDFVPVSLMCGGWNSMVLSNDGDLYGWGFNELAQLTLPGNTNRGSPELLAKGVKEVVLGQDHGIILKEDATFSTFGYNGGNQLGLNTTESFVVPPREIAMFTKKSALFIGSGAHATMVIDELGEIYVWGGASIWETIPTRVDGIKFPRTTITRRWLKIFMWIFLGRITPDSAFYLIPKEIIFHTASLFSRR